MAIDSATDLVLGGSVLRDLASSGAAGSGELLLDCPVCLLSGGPVPSAAEAVQLAGIHDDVHHRGAPTTVVHVEGGAR